MPLRRPGIRPGVREFGLREWYSALGAGAAGGRAVR